MKNKFLHWLESKRFLVGFLTLIFCECCYSFTNYLTTQMHPYAVPMCLIDRAMPFYPLSVWIYSSEIIMCSVAFFWAKNLDNLARYLSSLITITIIAAFIFMLFPTSFSRLPFPIPSDLDYFTFGLFNWVRHIDYPTNCLPSLHVCYSYLASFVFLKEQRTKFPFFFAWASFIALSTMMTKQHYFLDVMVGLTLAYGIYRLFLYWIPAEEKQKMKMMPI